MQRGFDCCVLFPCFQILHKHSCCDVEAERNERIHLDTVSTIFLRCCGGRQTSAISTWLIIFIILVIWSAATMHRRLDSALIWAGNRFLSALKIAAWCKQMVAVWMFMLRKITLGSLIPAGSRRLAGNDRDVLRRMLSKERCRFQKAPFRS